MPSPFPGMNPYVEHPSVWEDFHQRYLTRMSETIGAAAGPMYVVRLQAHIYLHELAESDRSLVVRADLGVSARHEDDRGGGGTAVLEAPIMVDLPVVDREKSSYIEIRDRDQNTLVTVIEMLSPANKYSGPDREAYLAKRKNLLNGPTNFVELDLMRGGPRMPIREMTECAYCVLVRRVVDWPKAGLWPVQVREPLPSIPIPLRPPDADVTLDLQKLLHVVYDAANYAHYIYRTDPQPPLNAADSAWVGAFTGVESGVRLGGVDG